MRLSGDMLKDIDEVLSIALEFVPDHTIVTEEKNEECVARSSTGGLIKL